MSKLAFKDTIRGLICTPVFPVDGKLPEENIKNEYSLKIPFFLKTVDILRKGSDSGKKEEVLEIFPFFRTYSCYTYG